MADVQQPLVGIIMGSDSDLNIMQAAADILKFFEVPFELTVVSAQMNLSPLRLLVLPASLWRAAATLALLCSLHLD